MTDYLVNRTAMSLEYLESIKDCETYMFAAEAKKGYTDIIIGCDSDIEYNI